MSCTTTSNTVAYGLLDNSATAMSVDMCPTAIDLSMSCPSVGDATQSRRYEELLAGLTHQALQQQEEIAWLKRQLEAREVTDAQKVSCSLPIEEEHVSNNIEAAEPNRHKDEDQEPTEDSEEKLRHVANCEHILPSTKATAIINYTVCAAMEKYLREVDERIGKCMADRVARVTTSHIKRTVDKALGAELKEREEEVKEQQQRQKVLMPHAAVKPPVLPKIRDADITAKCAAAAVLSSQTDLYLTEISDGISSISYCESEDSCSCESSSSSSTRVSTSEGSTDVTVRPPSVCVHTAAPHASARANGAKMDSAGVYMSDDCGSSLYDSSSMSAYSVDEMFVSSAAAAVVAKKKAQNIKKSDEGDNGGRSVTPLGLSSGRDASSASQHRPTTPPSTLHSVYTTSEWPRPRHTTANTSALPAASSFFSQNNSSVQCVREMGDSAMQYLLDTFSSSTHNHSSEAAAAAAATAEACHLPRHLNGSGSSSNIIIINRHSCRTGAVVNNSSSNSTGSVSADLDPLIELFESGIHSSSFSY